MKGEYISIETLRIYQEIEKENKELHEKIDKAIEYIKDKYDDDLFDDTLTQFQDNLLNILRGDNYE